MGIYAHGGDPSRTGPPADLSAVMKYNDEPVHTACYPAFPTSTLTLMSGGKLRSSAADVASGWALG
jgi:hypothetical protein